MEEGLTFVHLALPSWQAVPGLVDWLLEQGRGSGVVSRARQLLIQSGQLRRRETEGWLEAKRMERRAASQAADSRTHSREGTRGKLIADTRRRKGWTQQQLGVEMATRMGRNEPVKQGTISQIELGNVNEPTHETLEAIAQALDLDVEDLRQRKP